MSPYRNKKFGITSWIFPKTSSISPRPFADSKSIFQENRRVVIRPINLQWNKKHPQFPPKRISIPLETSVLPNFNIQRVTLDTNNSTQVKQKCYQNRISNRLDVATIARREARRPVPFSSPRVEERSFSTDDPPRGHEEGRKNDTVAVRSGKRSLSIDHAARIERGRVSARNRIDTSQSRRFIHWKPIPADWYSASAGPPCFTFPRSSGRVSR